ncbi:MAG: HdeD family acid-resistance protein [Planctomycetia bacterium]|nr:HdeD family acid-resistance protein [Planctomycetia bacterium]
MHFRTDYEFITLNAKCTHVFGETWKWITALGVVMMLLGAVALGASMFVTLATMVFIGMLMLVGGLLQAIHAISLRRWSGYYVDLIAGILYAAVGFVLVAHPGATAVGLTLILVLFLYLSGTFRILIGLVGSDRVRLWLLFYGLLNLLLGYVIWHDWPVAGLWIIGLFIGIEMFCNGWSLVMLGLAVKKLTTTH